MSIAGNSQPRQQPTLPYAHDLAGSKTTGWWGMVLIIVTEAVTFAALISAYFYLRARAPVWPRNDIARPELLLPLINTLVLLASSWPIQMALHNIRKGDRRGLRIGLGIGAALGILFLILQGVEYMRAEFSLRSNVYGSLFFTITGIHGLHVLAAVVMVIVLIVWASMGFFSSRRYQAVENVVLYWHFVDVVWIAIMASLYLSPYLA